MKKIDIELKISNLNIWEAEKLYIRLDKGLNPLHATMVQIFKEQLIKQLGYTPK